MVKAHKSAREYIRVSHDSSGRLRSPEEQHADNERAGQQQGITLGQPYAEPDAVSASQYAKKARLGFGQLMDDLRGGRFGADVLVLWEPSRGSRTVAEWADLLDTCRDVGVHIMITTHGRIYDPAHGRDRRTLHEDATDAEYESWKTHERVTRAVNANAIAGGPHGQVPYGYRRVYGPSGRLIRQEADDLEAPHVRAVYSALRQGRTLTAVVRAFALVWVSMVLAAWRATGDAALAFVFGSLGPASRAGRPWRVVDIRDMALRASYAGFRVHHKGRHAGRGRWHPGAVRTKAWPALVDEDTFFAVRDMLQDPKRLTHGPAEGRYLLSGIAVDDRCGEVLHVLYRQGTARYRCPGSHVLVPAAALDEYVEAAIVGYLSRPDVYEGWAQAAHGDELTQLRDDLAGRRADYAAADPEVHPPADMEEARAVAALRRRLSDEIADMERRERQMSVPPVLGDMIGPDAAGRWGSAPMSARREVTRLVLTPDRLGQVRVLPWPAGLWVRAVLPIRDRVRWNRDHAAGSAHNGV